MDLFIKTGVTDLTAAAVTSASDMTALVTPDGLPQLVLGTTEPVSVKFLTAASSYESWSGDATYTVTASLGAVTFNGLDNLAEGTLSTAITNGKSGYLALTTTDLIDYIERAFGRNARAASVQLTLQITVTDPTGYRRVYAMLPITVWGRVSSFTPDNTPLPSTLFLTTAEAASTYLTRAAGYHATANSTGDSTITPSSTSQHHTEVVTISGSAGTRNFAVATTGRTAGDTCTVVLALPVTASILVNVRDASATGTVLAAITTDGSGEDCAIDLVYTGTAWVRSRVSFPA